MKRKYILGTKEQGKYILVDPKVHLLIKLYAKEKGTSMSEAVYILLRKAFAQEVGLEVEDER
jgi:GTP cyclohydrolase FolE2